MTRTILRSLFLMMGRKNLFRLSRFAMRTARGDVDNTMDSNGELMVQRVALESSRQETALIFDVGANVGLWTEELLRNAKTLRPVQVFAFEPCAETFDMLKARLGSRENVLLTPKACSDKTGTALLHVIGPGAGTNTLSEIIVGHANAEQQVEITTVDEFCHEQGIAHIDLLKIDAEGHDYGVISGAKEMLQRDGIRIIQFEYNHRWIGSRSYLRDVFSLLSPLGYVIGKLVNDHVEWYPKWLWEMENYAEGNYIACKKVDVNSFRSANPEWIDGAATF